jgi:ATP-dependent helicase/nuclease subunit A
MQTWTDIELTEEQRAVVASSHPKLVVVASAGAGKTRVLVERYLKHVTVDHISPDQILTITFTRKAAAEMKRRIVDRLRANGLLEEAQIAETGPVQTIHGFCERLLKENALAAGLDPGFEILAGPQAGRMLEDAIRDAIAFPPEQNPHAERLITELAGRRTYQEWASPHALLSKIVREILRVLRGSQITWEQLAERHEDPERLREVLEFNLMLEVPEVVRAAMGSGDSLGVRLTAAYRATKTKQPRWLKPCTEEADRQCLEHACGLAQIAAKAWRTFERNMIREQALDFTMLEAKAVQLLWEKPEVRERVRRQYSVLLVDEAQDVNPMQHKLLQALDLDLQMRVGDAQQSIYGFRQADVNLFKEHMTASEVLNLSKNWRSDPGILAFIDALFGNIWQAEYRAMGKNSDGFDPESTEEHQAMHGVEFWLQVTRDTPGTAHEIKRFTEGLDQVQIDDGGQLRCARPGDVAVLVRNTRTGIELLTKLEQHGVRARIVGGSERFYARLEVRDLANALRALADPYDDFALLCMLRSPILGLSLDSVVELARRSPVVDALPDYEPLVDADREKLAGFLPWFLGFKDFADRLSAWEIIGEILNKTPYLENLARRWNGVQVIANVRKLFTLATEEPDLGPLAYAERLLEIQLIQHPEGDAPAEDEDDQVLTIMTIHKAKGLEFPVVIIPETHWEPGSRSHEVEADPWLGLVTTRLGSQGSIFHLWLEARRHRREEEEELRVLYVALTRAKHRLTICLHPKARNTTLAARICRELGYKDNPPPGVVVRE